MSDKCEHNTTVTMFVKGYLTVELCTWGCGNILVCEADPNGTTKTLREIEHPELSALRAEVEALKWVVKRLEFIHENDDEFSNCPICRGVNPTHYEDCELAAALNAPSEGQKRE